MVILKRRLANWLRWLPPLRWALALGVRIWMPRHYVGAVGVVFDDVGHILLVEHVFRPYYPWGLPGGWVERGENPADTVRRELKEELGMTVEVKQLLFCRPQGHMSQSGLPPGLGLAFYCRPASNGECEAEGISRTARDAYEILSTVWVDPLKIEEWTLTSLDQQAITLAKQEFDREQKTLDVPGTL